jgi:hypothetical protein
MPDPSQFEKSKQLKRVQRLRGGRKHHHLRIPNRSIASSGATCAM